MLLLEPFYDTFRDVHEAADRLAEELREHVDSTPLCFALGEGSARLTGDVCRRLGFESASVDEVAGRHVPRTVVLVAERIRRIGPVDEAIAKLLHAGAERILIAMPLAESTVAYQVDDRADVFICLRRAPHLGPVRRWYDHWSMPGSEKPRPRPPRSTPLLAAVG